MLSHLQKDPDAMKRQLEDAAMIAGVILAFFVLGMIGAACDGRTIPDPPTPTVEAPAPQPSIEFEEGTMIEETIPEEAFPAPAPTDDVAVEAPAPGEADCGGIRETLDFLDSPYEIVDSSLGPVCVEQDLGVYLYMNSNVSCEVAEAASIPAEVGFPDGVLYGCEG